MLPEERARDENGNFLPWGYRYLESVHKSKVYRSFHLCQLNDFKLLSKFSPSPRRFWSIWQESYNKIYRLQVIKNADWNHSGSAKRKPNCGRVWPSLRQRTERGGRATVKEYSTKYGLGRCAETACSSGCDCDRMPDLRIFLKSLRVEGAVEIRAYRCAVIHMRRLPPRRSQSRLDFLKRIDALCRCPQKPDQRRTTKEPSV